MPRKKKDVDAPLGRLRAEEPDDSASMGGMVPGLAEEAPSQGLLPDAPLKRGRKRQEKFSSEADLPLPDWAVDGIQDVKAALEKAKGFNMGAHIQALIWESPFFGAVLRGVTKIPTFTVPTAGVTAVGHNLVLVWNPVFFSQLAPSQVKTILMHEAYHIFFMHLVERQKQPPEVWNYAADLAINCLLTKSADDIRNNRTLTQGALYPGVPFEMSDEVRQKWAEKSPEKLARFDKVSQKLASFPVEKSAEWYFSALMEDPEIANAIQKRGVCGEGDDGDDPLPGTLDDHGGWGEVDEEQRDVLRERMRDILREAMMDVERHQRGWGSVPNHIREMLREMFSNVIDWRVVLRNFVGQSKRAKSTTTMKRINRKFPYIHPGRKRGYSARIDVYIDQSGSVSNEAIAAFFGELDHLSRRTDFHLWFFDTAVVDGQEWRRGQKVPPYRRASGGTDFNAPTIHANRRKGEVDGILILTDGECSKPQPSLVRRAWVICPDHKLLFEPDSNELVINMTHDKKQD